MTNAFRSNELSITIYMIMESEKVVSVPPSFCLPPYSPCMTSRVRLRNRKKNGKEGIVCYIDRSFLLSRVQTFLSFLPLLLSLLWSVTRDDVFWFHEQILHPISADRRTGPSLSCPRMIGDFCQKSNKSCPSLTVKRISGPSKEINL